ncbi:MAG: zinc ribbon domain-containing protein [Candidatus Aminicenantes bacterium]|nr:MAG: zinc ribbon domain-containing protein [Candidatus Aminicenantes bacterium]
MPIYEFTCNKCNNHFECLVSIGKEKDVSCSACGSNDIRKLFSSFGIGGGGNRISSSSSACTTCSATSCSTCK